MLSLEEQLANANAKIAEMQLEMARNTNLATFLIDENKHYVYLLRTRHSIEIGDKVHKFGRTQNLEKRIRGYPKGAMYLNIVFCSNAPLLEERILDRAKKECCPRTDYGSEYFEADYNVLAQILYEESKVFTHACVVKAPRVELGDF